MAFNSAPGNLFTGYQLLANGEAAPSQGIFIPLTTLAILTAAEADESTGDSREVLRSILVAASERIAALPAADRPTKMTITVPNATTLTGNQLRQQYNVTVDTTYQASNLSLVPEA